MKRILAFMLAVIMLFLFAGCGGSAEVSSKATPSDNSKPEEPSSTPEPSSSEEASSEEVSSEAESAPEKTELTLKIGSYNIANGSKCGHNMQLLADDILSKKLDIVGFREVDHLSSRAQFLDTMKVLSEKTGYKYYFFAKAISLEPYGLQGDYGIGILSKYPILETNNIPIDSTPFHTEDRTIAYAKIDVNGHVINFFNTHLSYETEELRNHQITYVANVVKDYKNCIVTGDFNIMSFDELAPFKNLSLSNNADNKIHTYYEEGWFDAIDNVLYSKEYSFVSAGALNNNHSDHHLFYAELKVK